MIKFCHCWIVLLILGAIFPQGSSLAAGPQAVLKVQKSTIVVRFNSEPADDLQMLVLKWIARSARAVAIYYGDFPVRKLEIQINLREGQRIGSGETFGGKEPFIKISVGRNSPQTRFADDWEMTHEMTHLAFPAVDRAHHWIEEGSATYIEPVARARAGDLTAEKIWGDMMKGMKRGLPGPNDRGLDFTLTWGRTYWGGALFCLIADVEIRQRTNNRRGLEHAFRAIVKTGGNITQDWEIERALKVGDRAIGVPVLEEMYDQWKGAPVSVDLEQLWKDLGVVREGSGVVLDDSAPLASIRRAITAQDAVR